MVFKMPAIFGKNEVTRPDAGMTTNGMALHFSTPVERRAPPTLPPPLPEERPKLVLGFDATASREHAWATSIELTDAVLGALPGQLDIALAVHGGGRLHTFTAFTSKAVELRARAAKVRCQLGYTRLLDILTHTLKTRGVSVVVYIGDSFEESERSARKLADALKAHGTRLIILHDSGQSLGPDIFTGWTYCGPKIFADMAARTEGAVLPFDSAALPKLRELLSAVAVLAVGGVSALTAQRETMPAARLLLEHLGGKGSS